MFNHGISWIALDGYLYSLRKNHSCHSLSQLISIIYKEELFYIVINMLMIFEQTLQEDCPRARVYDPTDRFGLYNCVL